MLARPILLCASSLSRSNLSSSSTGISGIGRELVLQLIEAGASVVVIDQNAAKGAELVGSLQQIHFIQADMADPVEAEKSFEEIKTHYASIDYVFNNAGIFMGGEIRDTPLKNWKPVVDNNIWAVANGTHFAYQAMLKQGYGHIVNVASATGIFPVPGMGIYGSSKYAIVGLGSVLRVEAKKLGIKVSTACPTIVDTPLYDTATYNGVDVKRAMKARTTFQTPDVTARRILKRVRKNKAIIHTANSTLFAWIGFRLSPSLYMLSAQKVISVYRKKLRKIKK